MLYSTDGLSRNGILGSLLKCCPVFNEVVMQAVQIYAKFDYEVELMKVGHGHGYIRLNYSAYGVFSYSNLLIKSLQCGLLSLVCFLICLPFVIT